MSVKTIADQIRDFENTRGSKAAQMNAIMEKASAEGRSTDEAEAEEFDSLDAEIKQLDQDIGRLRRIEALQVSRAAPVDGSTVQRGSSARHVGGPTIVVKDNSEPESEKFAGQFYTRMVIAKTLGVLNYLPASVVAERRWGKTHKRLVEVLKANEVASGGSDSGEWGAELVSADNRYTGDFITFLQAQTVYDRLGLREVPANVSIKGEDGAATGYWIGQSKAIKASAPSYSTVSLTPLKVAALAVVSKELLRDSSPAAEALVRDALVQASSQRVDSTFLSTTAASAGVSPAGMLNGLSAISSAGNSASSVRADIAALYAGFISDKNATGLVFVTTPSVGKQLQLMTNALGQAEFPGVSQNGGTLMGDPVITGDNVGANDLILLKPSEIYRIGDSGLEIDVSRDATVEMSSAPVGAADVPTGGTENPVSMFQTDSVAIKVVRSINFAKRRTGAVAYVGDANYDGIAT